MLYDPEYPGYLGNNLHHLILSDYLYRQWEHYGNEHVLLYFNGIHIGTWAKCLRYSCCLVEPGFNCSIVKAVRKSDNIYLGHVAICNNIIIPGQCFRIDHKYIKQ